MDGRTARVAHLVIGPDRHGVVRAALSTVADDAVVVRAETPADADLAQLGRAGVVHTHFTDQLFGTDCDAAAASFRSLAAALAVPLTVTLHDLPHDDGSDRYRRRAAAYRVVTDAAAGVVVSSRHERMLLLAAGACAPDRHLTVIPLPLDRQPGAALVPAAHHAEVAVLGWIYPGKGHAEVLAALPPGATLVALGEVSPGHDSLLAELESLSEKSLRCTGFLPDAELSAAMRSIAVPVAWHAHVSASASIGSWLEAGRRPIVRDGAWARELEERCPGSLVLTAEGGLSAAIGRAMSDRARTWLGDTAIGPGRSEVAAALDAFCRSVARDPS